MRAGIHIRHDIKITFNCVNLNYPLHIAKKELISGQFNKKNAKKKFSRSKEKYSAQRTFSTISIFN